MRVNLAEFDFGGYATKSGLKCTDGRTILADAFKTNDGTKVPLVWQHQHNSPENVLGHAVLENRADGVYAYCKFNDTQAGTDAKILVMHKDVDALSIYANQLVEKGKIVHGGSIREVSLVLSGANPGALIDYLNLVHGEGQSESEAIIYSGEPITTELVAPVVEHADAPVTPVADKTVGDIFNSMTDEQKTVVYALFGKAMSEQPLDMAQSNLTEGDPKTMKKNVFEGQNGENAENQSEGKTLTHAQILEILSDAQKTGSLRESFLAHAVTYGIENIDYLFPDAKNVTNAPEFVKRDTAWVSAWMSGTRHTPFSRIKSMSADITLDTARALGYVKGNLKKEEFFALAKRSTGPTTIYKKQKLDRDDILDITDLDVVVWLKAEMRVMLDEEAARACLIGDGRDVEVGGNANPDKIDETCIRPVYNDDALYVTHVQVASDAEVEDMIDSMISARVDYKGSGNPVMFTTTAFLTSMLLLKDSVGRRIYRSQADLESELRVSRIVEVPVMTGVSRDITSPAPATLNLLAILVNPLDYTIGADKGAAIGMFDDFDIDYNQYKYLIETRISGALTSPKTALVIEQVAAGA